MTYPDSHPAMAQLVTVTGPEGSRQFVPRSVHEDVLAERDNLRQALAVAAAGHFFAGRTAAVVDVGQVLEKAGFGAGVSAATLDIIEQVRGGSL